MGLSMRPIREEWGESTSLFLEANSVVDLLTSICESLDIAYGLKDAEEGTEVVVQDGTKFLDYIESEQFTTPNAYGLLNPSVNRDGLDSLVENLKSLVNDWRRFVDSDELRILVD